MGIPQEGSLRTVAAPRSGASRVRSAKAGRIASVVSGYSSTISLAEGLRLVYLIWACVGLGHIATGIVSITATTTEQLASVDRLFISVQVAHSFLGLVSIILWFAWLAPTWANVAKLGRTARVGYFKILFRHLAALPLMLVVLLVGFVIVPDLSRTALLIVALLGIYLYAAVPMMLYRTFEMLWETSTLPGRGTDALPHLAVVWVVAFFGHSYGFGLLGSPTSSLLAGLVTIVSGVMTIVAAVCAAKLSLAISVRQDARLTAIINEIQEDAGVAKPDPDQLENEWKASERLVEFNH